MNCVRCKLPIERVDLLLCSGCKEPYHYRCLNISSDNFKEKSTELKRTFRCESCLNVTRRIRVSDDTPVRSGKAATGTIRGDITGEEGIYQPLEGSKQEKQINKATNQDGTFDMSLFLDMVNEAVAAKMDKLESKLIKEIREAVTSLSEQENIRLKNDLKEANGKCILLQAEINNLKKELDKCSVSGKIHKQIPKKQQLQQPRPGGSDEVKAVGTSHDVLPAVKPAVQTKPMTSYSDMARSTQVASNKDEPPAQQMRTSLVSDENSWIEVRPKKVNPIKKGGNMSIVRIKAVERKKYFHIWRLVTETTEENLLEYIREILGEDSYIKVDKINHKTERGYSSFRVCVSEGNYEKLCNPDIWPNNAEYSEWIWFRRSTENSKTQTTK